jgi:nucleoid-associated protein YgaU
MKRFPKTTVQYLREKFAENPISYKTAFVIVVLLHIAAYGGITLLSKYKAERKKIIAAENSPGPYSDALEDAWPTDNLKLKVVAKPTPKASPSIKPIAEATKAVLKSTPKAIALATPSPEPVQKPSIKPIEETKKSVVSVPKPTPQSTPLVASIKPIDEAPRTVSTPRPTPQSTPVVASIKLDENSPSLSAQIPPRPIFEQKPVPNHLPPDMDKALKEMAKEIQRDVDSSSANKNTYTIQPGENLYMIARKLQVSFRSIVIANDIRDPRDLRVGQTLRIPRRQGI